VTDEGLRARLEALNRAPMPHLAALASRATAAVVAAVQGPPHRLRTGNQGREVAALAPLEHCPIAGLLRSGEVVETAFGPHLRIDLPLDGLWQGGAKLIAARQEFLRFQAGATARAIEPTCVVDVDFSAFIAALPDRTIALDLETCGLAGSALFLVGLLRQIQGVPTVQLLLARNYAEEAAVLASLWNLVAEHDVLLTFNGKSFDWPMVVERSVRHRLEVAPTGWTSPIRKSAAAAAKASDGGPTKVHIDILHHARRRWRKQLPNCRLQTLELHVCRRKRTGDIPGHAIPAAYANYVRTGFEREMDAVLYHNALDLVTLFDLAHRLAA
jgi:uncharacterized protein YprB with RNaseH-like and TPR domain